MSRFDSLEFDDNPSKRAKAGGKPEATGTPIRDADYFHKEADRAFYAGDYEAALKSFSKALQRDNTRLPCWLGQVRCLIELGELKEADMWADKALERSPEHPELLAAKAVAHARMGLLSQAMSYSDNASARTGATPFVWLARGEVLLQRQSRTADHCFAQALSLCDGPTSRGWAQLDLARLLRLNRRYSRALEHATEAAQALPREALAWTELGSCQAALGLREAAESFRRALELQPDSLPARSGLKSLQRRGWAAGLRAFFRRILGR